MRLRTLVPFLLLVAGPALAVQQRSFVSSAGLDTNDCSRSAPCRTFAQAIAMTTAGGEVVAIDSAGYGPFAVLKAVTIAAPEGVYAGITTFSGDGVDVVAAATDPIVLRNLAISGLGGQNGITLVSAGALHIDHCTISGLANDAIHLLPTTHVRVTISDTTVRESGRYGIYGDSGLIFVVVVDHCRAERNMDSGIVADRAEIAIRDSVVSNSNVGFYGRGGGGPVFMTIASSMSIANVFDGVRLDNGVVVAHDVTIEGSIVGFYVNGAGTTKASLDSCTLTYGTVGVNATGSASVSVMNSTISDYTNSGVSTANGATAYLAHNMITRNATGIQAANGVVVSAGDNVTDGNTTQTTGTITAANKN